MDNSRYLTSSIVLDASPLICLTKLEALDVLSVATRAAAVTPMVFEEATRPQLAYRHPDAVEIEQAVASGRIETLELSGDEESEASSMLERIPGLHHGEAEVLSVAVSRSMPAVIFERRARRVARMLGAELVDVTELIVAGTVDGALMEDRIVRFARMVNMRFDHVTELLSRIGSRRII
jgi:predicted nucleic acid-binding protein